jgi:AraC-like DNA-binding protein
MTAPARDRARFLRPSADEGVEALHATFLRHRYPPHAHDVLTIASVHSGAATFVLEGRRYTAPAGTLFLIPPNAAHTGEPAAAGGYSYRVLYLDLGKLSMAFDGAHERSPIWRRSLVVIEHDELESHLHRTHLALADGSSLEQGEALVGTVDTLARLFVGSRPRPEPTRPPHPAVLRARDYLDSHWTKNVTLQELAASSGVGRYHLIRLFNSQMGMPPSYYARSLKIEAARRMLRAGEPITMVAAMCGFYDQAHLTRHFKRVVGVTPARYATST